MKNSTERKKSPKKLTKAQVDLAVDSIFNTPPEVVENTKRLVEIFEKGCPRATSAEVLYSRVK